MDEIQQNIAKLKDKKTKDAFKVYIYNKIGSMPSDVTINSWISDLRQPSHVYSEFINSFFLTH